jgi:hypothetical protein
MYRVRIQTCCGDSFDFLSIRSGWWLNGPQFFHTPDKQVVAGSRKGYISIVGDFRELPALIAGQERDHALIAYLMTR